MDNTNTNTNNIINDLAGMTILSSTTTTTTTTVAAAGRDTDTNNNNNNNNNNNDQYYYPSDNDADNEEDYNNNNNNNNNNDDQSLESESSTRSMPPLVQGRYNLSSSSSSSSEEDDDDDDSIASIASSSTGSIPPLIPRNWLGDSSSDEDDSDIDDNDMPHLVHGNNIHFHFNNNNNNNGNNAGGGFPFPFLAANHHIHNNILNDLHNRNNNNNRQGLTTELAFFREFLTILRNNDSTEMYRYYVSRQERLITLMLHHPDKADEFLAAAEGNTSLQHLHLDISFRFTDAQMNNNNNNVDNNDVDNDNNSDDDNDDDNDNGWMGQEEYYNRWRTIGIGISKLQGLEELQIHAGGYLMTQNAPDFEALAHVMIEGRGNGGAQIQKFVMTCDLLDGDNMEFAQAFRNHANLETMEFRGYFEDEPMDVMAQELVTMPKLSRMDLLNCFSRSIPSRVLPDSLLMIVQQPSICNLGLQRCIFSAEQCDILAECLRANISVETINFQYSQFEDMGGQKVAAALGGCTKLQKLVYSAKTLDRDICEALGETLGGTRSIEHLQIESEEEEWADEPDFDPTLLDPIFESLQSNATVNFLQIGELNQWNDDTAGKFRAVLESPTTAIAELWLKSQGDAFLPWERIVSVLSENRTLKTLKLLASVGHPGVVTTAAALATNTTLESFEVYPCSRIVCAQCENPFSSQVFLGSGKKPKAKICPEDCVTAQAVQALGKNCTLKRLMVDTCISHHTKDVSEEGCKQLVVALTDNFGLEDDDMSWGRQRSYKKKMEILARLNKAGRRYLLDDPSNFVIGVRILGEVSDSLDCVFTHLEENPGICDFQR